MEIAVTSTISIREAGMDEFWLQEQIWKNPTILGLGDLEQVSKEKIQAGGRLDILLKDLESDTMYEVEVMLGATDESHIVRTIEYWDNEKRKWPQRQHYAVLVAESITRRFFNVIQLFSHVIPLIAIQVNLLQIGNERVLHFTKILDTYEEPDDGASNGVIHDQSYWNKKAKWTLDTAKSLNELVKEELPNCEVHPVQNYISIFKGGYNYITLYPRSFEKTLLCFGVREDDLDEAAKLLDEASITYATRNRKEIKFIIDAKFLQLHSELLLRLMIFIKSRLEN